MKIIDRIVGVLEKIEQRRKDRLRSRIEQDLEYIQSHDNKGLLKKRLLSMPEVKGAPYHFEYGGLSRGLFKGYMKDGYEIYVGDYWPTDILKKAVIQVARRLVDKYDLEPIETVNEDGEQIILGGE